MFLAVLLYNILSLFVINKKSVVNIELVITHITIAARVLSLPILHEPNKIKIMTNWPDN